MNTNCVHKHNVMSHCSYNFDFHINTLEVAVTAKSGVYPDIIVSRILFVSKFDKISPRLLELVIWDVQY